MSRLKVLYQSQEIGTGQIPERLEQVFIPILEMFGGAQPSVSGVGVATLAAPAFQTGLELTVRLPDL